MKNITLAVEDEVLDQVRRYAVNNGKTVNAIVRDFLNGIAQQEDRMTRARRRLLELSEKTTLEAGPVTWKRGELHDR